MKKPFRREFRRQIFKPFKPKGKAIMFAKDALVIGNSSYLKLRLNSVWTLPKNNSSVSDTFEIFEVGTKAEVYNVQAFNFLS